MQRDARVLLVFLTVVLVVGGNFVGVRFSNRELAPFWGAGLRFVAGAALILAGVYLGALAPERPARAATAPAA